MNNFRKRTDSGRQPKAVDGFITRTNNQSQLYPGSGQARTFRGRDFLRPESPIGNFRRSEGLHTDAAGVWAGKSARQQTHKPEDPKPKSESILHMTLPGGTLHNKRKEKKSKSRSKFRSVLKWTTRSVVALACIGLISGGFLAVQAYLNAHRVFKGGGNAAALNENVKPEQLNGEGDGRVNVLLLGKGGPGHDGADLTDTILLASIDPVNNSAGLVSIPRDLWVQSGGGSTKINAVYANAKSKALRKSNDQAAAQKAGVDAIKTEVSEILGVPIHYYAMVDFEAFRRAVDTVGGVTIDVPQDLIDYSVAWENGGSPVLARKGTQTFNGKQALLYVRSRHGSARGDFDRAERQRLFIMALSHKVLSAGTYTNPVKISQLLDNFGDHVSTDFTVSQMLRLMEIGKKIPSSAMTSIDLAAPPHVLVKTSNVSGLSVVVPTAGVGDYSAIQTYVRQQLQDGYILKENAQISILNGTSTSGIATAKADELKNFGYNVILVGDAPTKTYTSTILVDLSKGKKPFTKNYLQKRFGVQVVTKLPDPAIQPGTADFVIILGSNASNNSQN